MVKKSKEDSNQRNCWNKDWSEDSRQESIGWALIFIFGALVLLAEITEFSLRFANWDGWSIFFTGFGVIVLAGMLINLLKGKMDKAVWNLVWGLIFLAIGLGNTLNFDWIWVAVLLVIGFVILKGAFQKKK